MAEQRQTDSDVSSASLPHTKVTLADLTQVVTLSPDALIIVDQAGTIVMANEQAAALFGCSVGQVQGQPLEMLRPPHQLLSLTHLLRA